MLGVYVCMWVGVSVLEGARVCAAPADIAAAATYLTQYGYLRNSPGAGTAALTAPSEETLSTALREFQAFAGLNVTGELDDPTVALMGTPRCGVQDMDADRSDDHVRRKRFDIHGSKWRVRNLTYHISKYPRRAAPSAVDSDVTRALDTWSQAADLTFQRWSTSKSSSPDGGQVMAGAGAGAEASAAHIDIRFERGDHGDWDVFDGPHGTLAHAFFPLYGGDVHFDDDEDWRVGEEGSGPSLYQIAVHELGHSLGLHHSAVRHSVMEPFYYRNYSSDFRLHQDDIDGIRYLYGVPSSLTTPTPANDLCSSTVVVDAIFTGGRDELYVFSGQVYYRLVQHELVPGYPRRIEDTWRGLPGHVDAAFTHSNGRTYFFKGSSYWRYVGHVMDGRFPRDISGGFPGMPGHMDAVIQWSGNGEIYFFKGATCGHRLALLALPVVAGSPTRSHPLPHTHPGPLPEAHLELEGSPRPRGRRPRLPRAHLLLQGRRLLPLRRRQIRGGRGVPAVPAFHQALVVRLQNQCILGPRVRLRRVAARASACR